MVKLCEFLHFYDFYCKYEGQSRESGGQIWVQGPEGDRNQVFPVDRKFLEYFPDFWEIFSSSKKIEIFGLPFRRYFGNLKKLLKIRKIL